MFCLEGFVYIYKFDVKYPSTVRPRLTSIILERVVTEEHGQTQKESD